MPSFETSPNNQSLRVDNPSAEREGNRDLSRPKKQNLANENPQLYGSPVLTSYKSATFRKQHGAGILPTPKTKYQ